MDQKVLNSIAESLVAESGSLSEALRKTLVLSYELRHGPLMEWVQKELDGYKSTDTIPEYRTFASTSFVNLANGYGVSIQNQTVRVLGQPEYVVEYITRPVQARWPVAVLDTMVATGKDYQEIWPADLRVRHAAYGWEGVDALRAWKVITHGQLVAVQEQIRNRILGFVLELGAVVDYAQTTPKSLNKAVNVLFDRCLFDGSPISISERESIIQSLVVDNSEHGGNVGDTINIRDNAGLVNTGNNSTQTQKKTRIRATVTVTVLLLVAITGALAMWAHNLSATSTQSPNVGITPPEINTPSSAPPPTPP